MAVLLMNLRNVPDDETEELRELLSANDIDFYETEPNHWGISMGGIWLRNKGQVAQARSLVDQYQVQRRRQAKEAYARRRQDGEAQTFIGGLRAHPLRTLIYLGVAAFFLYLSTMPFLGLNG